MRVYFLAETPCMLFINGLPLGSVDGFERSAEINPDDGVFCEYKSAEYLPVGFRLDQQFLLSPPPQIKLYYVHDGVAVYACDLLRTDQSLKVLLQERFGATRLTLLRQGKIQLDFSDGFHVKLLDLPPSLEHAKAYMVGREYLIEADNAFALVSHEGELLTVSEGHVLEKDPLLKAEIPFHDSCGHTAVCVWEAGKLKECKLRAKTPPTEQTLALALFEGVLIGADVTELLCDELKEKAPDLRDFLGRYLSVVPTQDQAVAGLVYRRKERIYDVRYFRIETSDGKITNLKEVRLKE